MVSRLVWAGRLRPRRPVQARRLYRAASRRSSAPGRHRPRRWSVDANAPASHLCGRLDVPTDALRCRDVLRRAVRRARTRWRRRHRRSGRRRERRTRSARGGIALRPQLDAISGSAWTRSCGPMSWSSSTSTASMQARTATLSSTSSMRWRRRRSWSPTPCCARRRHTNVRSSKRSPRAADAVVVMTEAGRRLLVGGFDVDATKVVVIPHGAAVTGAHRGRDPTRRVARSSPGACSVPARGSSGPSTPWPCSTISGLERPTGSPATRTPRWQPRRGRPTATCCAGGPPTLVWRDDVSFDAGYRGLDALAELISTASVVVLPYDSPDQVTSGVLVDAVAAGRPVVATAFPHAVELLASGAGIVVPATRSRGPGDCTAPGADRAWSRGRHGPRGASSRS